MRITSKGQATIPQEIRERCGLLPHTEVEFQPSRREEAIRRLRRARLRTRLSIEELLALTRGEDS